MVKVPELLFKLIMYFFTQITHGNIMLLHKTLGNIMILLVVKLPKLFNAIIGIVEFELAKLCFRLWQYYGSSHNTRYFTQNPWKVSWLDKRSEKKPQKNISDRPEELLSR